MAAKAICDGCGKEAPMVPAPNGWWVKPWDWFERRDDDGIQTACSRACIDTIAAATGKTGAIVPH